jgi:DNA polymerase
MRLHLDFEVFSEVDIKSAPLDVYAAHPSTKIILAAWAIDEGPVAVWEADKGKAPAEFSAALRNEDVQIVAWNVNYERTVLRAKGMDAPICRWLDPMAIARYVGLPGSLKNCAKVPLLGIPAEEATRSETLLIKKFCCPNKKGERNLRAGFETDWDRFVDYCRKDVETMRRILNWIEPRFPWPARERQIWELDQTINERGLPVDVSMARHGMKETERLLAASHKTLRDLTGLENPNSVHQLLPWLQENGYRYDSLSKEFLAQSEADELSPEAREVVSIRSEAAKSSVKKFAALVEAASPRHG